WNEAPHSRVSFQYAGLLQFFSCSGFQDVGKCSSQRGRPLKASFCFFAAISGTRAGGIGQTGGQLGHATMMSLVVCRSLPVPLSSRRCYLASSFQIVFCMRTRTNFHHPGPFGSDPPSG
ncbi:unnamed protein product, partial [Phaeothamnion confervicola]